VTFLVSIDNFFFLRCSQSSRALKASFMVIYRWKAEIDNQRAQVPTLASEEDQYPAEVLR
jgi:hypothetical protein